MTQCSLWNCREKASVRDFIIARSSLRLRVKWLKQQQKKYLNPPYNLAVLMGQATYS